MHNIVGKVVYLLRRHENEGIAKTALLQKSHLRAAVLDAVLTFLQQRGELRVESFNVPDASAPAWAKGRAGQRYWYVPSSTPTPLQLPRALLPHPEVVVPGRRKPAFVPAAKGTCHWCGKPTPPGVTKPLMYCSSACAQAVTRASQAQLRKITMRVQDAGTFNWVAIYLVVADLVSRGYDVWFSPISGSNGRVLATRGTATFSARVFIDHMAFFAAEDNEARVLVRRSGVIQYANVVWDDEDEPESKPEDAFEPEPEDEDAFEPEDEDEEPSGAGVEPVVAVEDDDDDDEPDPDPTNADGFDRDF